MMGCEGKGKALKLCEIAAAFVVAGELSLSWCSAWIKRRALTSGSTPTNAWVVIVEATRSDSTVAAEC